MSYWSWLLALIGVTGIFLVGKKKNWAWLVLCCNELIWIVYALATKQYGFIVMATAYTIVYLKSYKEWKKESLSEKIQKLHFPIVTKLPRTTFFYEACNECSSQNIESRFYVKYPCKTIKTLKSN